MVVGGVYRKLMEIESRLLPCGLHIIGALAWDVLGVSSVFWQCRLCLGSVRINTYVSCGNLAHWTPILVFVEAV